MSEINTPMAVLFVATRYLIDGSRDSEYYSKTISNYLTKHDLNISISDVLSDQHLAIEPPKRNNFPIMLAITSIGLQALRGGNFLENDLARHVLDNDILNKGQLIFTANIFADNLPVGYGERAFELLLQPDKDVTKIAEKTYALMSVASDLHDRSTFSNTDYRSGAELSAYNMLTQNQFVQKILNYYSGLHLEELQSIKANSSMIKVGDNQYSEIYWLWQESARRAGLDNYPSLFIAPIGYQYYITNTNNPIAVISSLLITILTHDELIFLFGHLLSYVVNDQLLFSTLAVNYETIKKTLSTLTLGFGGISDKIVHGLSLPLFNWYRESFVSADRYGYSICADKNTVFSALIKISGAPIRLASQTSITAIIDQYESMKTLMSQKDSIFEKIMRMEQSSAWPAYRIAEFSSWVTTP
jgi:Zn-dependent protease with chaperone function